MRRFVVYPCGAGYRIQSAMFFNNLRLLRGIGAECRADSKEGKRMTLHIETGDPVMANNKRVDGDAVRFVTEDGRTMFEVRADKDGRSIEVRSVECTKVNGVVYSSFIDVRPQVANSIKVLVRRYED